VDLLGDRSSAVRGEGLRGTEASRWALTLFRREMFPDIAEYPGLHFVFYVQDPAVIKSHITYDLCSGTC